MEEYHFVSVALNQSSAGELESVLLHCDLFTTSIKRVIRPSVCSFIDKPHRPAWRRRLRWRISCTLNKWRLLMECSHSHRNLEHNSVHSLMQTYILLTVVRSPQNKSWQSTYLRTTGALKLYIYWHSIICFMLWQSSAHGLIRIRPKMLSGQG